MERILGRRWQGSAIGSVTGWEPCPRGLSLAWRRKMVTLLASQEGCKSGQTAMRLDSAGAARGVPRTMLGSLHCGRPAPKQNWTTSFRAGRRKRAGSRLGPFAELGDIGIRRVGASLQVAVGRAGV